MSETSIDIQEVINDLAEQVKRLTVDNAVLRAALTGQRAEQLEEVGVEEATEQE